MTVCMTPSPTMARRRIHCSLAAAVGITSLLAACSGGGAPAAHDAAPSARDAAPSAHAAAPATRDAAPAARDAAADPARRTTASTSPDGTTAPNQPVAAPTVDPAVALNLSTLSTTAQGDDGGGTDAPLTVRFSVEVEKEGGRPPYRHVWDFGDATPAVEGAKPTHVYRLPGSFRASVMTVDADGQYDQDWVDVLVQPNYEAMGLSPEEIRQRMEAARELARKSLEAMQSMGGPAGPGAGATSDRAR